MNNFYLLIIITVCVLTPNLSAQPDLDVEPQRVTFEDIFNRYDYTTLINRGDEVLRIDSLSSSKSFYLLDFEDAQQLPLFINPGDTVKLNIVLTNFYNITAVDTSDTVWVYSNDSGSPWDLRIKIDFIDDDYGLCAGNVSDEALNPLPNSKLFFLYYGVYLFDSTFTDAEGNYNVQLPKGNYIIAAEQEGYRIMYSGNTPDPFFAEGVQLDSGEAVNVDLLLPPVGNTGYSISGLVIDSVYGNQINKGVVLIRKGKHTPTLRKPGEAAADTSVYSAFIRSDGSYKVTVASSDYYFVQGYSDYFLPAYLNDQNAAEVFWQNGDSVLINETLTNRNLYLKRDSSYGGGSIYGHITMPVPEFEGITVLARSTSNDQFYSYNFGKEDGSFNISNLPYGSYQLIAQKVGFPNALSSTFTISPDNQHIYNFDFQFPLAGTEKEKTIPGEIKLYPNYPNPFNPETTISFYIPMSGKVTLKIFDLLGNEITTLLNQEKSPGYYQVKWNATSLPSGVYFYKLQVGNFNDVKKLVLMK